MCIVYIYFLYIHIINKQTFLVLYVFKIYINAIIQFSQFLFSHNMLRFIYVDAYNSD